MSGPNSKPEEFPEAVYGDFGTKERRHNLQKNNWLGHNYGLTLKAYKAMARAQDYKCAVCGEPETGVHRRGKKEVPLSLAVDHDHETGCVRALLCHKCNKALGLFNDDAKLLRDAAQYLESHRGYDNF